MFLDKIIDERVGFGKAQSIPFAFLCLIDMNDGVQLVLSSFLNTVLKYEWKLSSAQVSLLASTFFIGVFFGSILSGRLADIYGRKKIITIGSIMQFCVASSFNFVNNMPQMIAVRFFYGFAFGFTVVITTSMYAESSPKAFRGKGLLILNFFISIGKIYAFILVYLCLEDFRTGNWKLMMILSALPNLIVLYGSFYHLRQSPRFLIAKSNYFQAYQIIDQMIFINNGPNAIPLSAEEKDQIEKEGKIIFDENANPGFRTLFNKVNLLTTLSLCGAWMSLNFAYYGQLVMLPFILGAQQKSFSAYLATIFGQIPSLLISIYLIDHIYFGRKRTMIIVAFSAGIFHLLFSAFSFPSSLFSSIARFFMKLIFQMIYPCTTESFITPIRTLAFGFCSAIGKLAAIIMPYVLFPLLERSEKGAFVVIAIMCFICSWCSYLIPRDPMHKSIDEAGGKEGTLNEKLLM